MIVYNKVQNDYFPVIGMYYWPGERKHYFLYVDYLSSSVHVFEDVEVDIIDNKIKYNLVFEYGNGGSKGLFHWSFSNMENMFENLLEYSTVAFDILINCLKDEEWFKDYCYKYCGQAYSALYKS
ncbi:hypothetical protein VQ643_16075 [Pseudomonas sp. F1_0610]|uniref:hypothetical protein n=1 Tax=Pseudomonas sp. F1_0610 TaxID=3114284 RepID=UPI0039C1996A